MVLAYCTAEQTHQPFPHLYTFLHIICQPRHYYISEDKNVPLTFSPTPHSSHSLFFSSCHPASLCRFFFLPFLIRSPYICTSPSPLTPHLFWSLAPLLIHCSVSRSIERLSVRRSHCTPHPSLPSSPSSLMSPQTADTLPAGKLALFFFYIPYWRASPLLSPPLPFLLFGSLFISAPQTRWREKKCTAP